MIKLLMNLKVDIYICLLIEVAYSPSLRKITKKLLLTSESQIKTPSKYVHDTDNISLSS